MTQQVHQDVHADLCVGQFGGEGMPKPVQQSPFRAGTVDPGLPEGAQDPILQGAAGDALAVATDEQRCVGGPAGQSPGGGGAASGFGESGFPAAEVVLEDVDEDGFEGMRRSLSPLPRTRRTAPSSVRRRSPMLSRTISSARRPASSQVRMMAGHAQAGGRPGPLRLCRHRG